MERLLHAQRRVLRSWLCWISGSAIVLATVVDVVWTALGTHGGGPLSGRFTAGLWHVATALHKRWPHHRLLSFAGSALLAALMLMWTVLVWTGWLVIFYARPDMVVDANRHQPVDFFMHAYFVGSAISTVGSSEIVPNGSFNHFLLSVASLNGIGTLTLAITFVMQVLASVVEKRMVGAYISDMGGTPSKILKRSWTGEEYDSLTDHLLALTTLMQAYTEQHLAYPILLYYHSENERTAATLRIAALNELVLLLAEGTQHEYRLSPMIVEPLRESIHGLAKVMEGQYIDPPEQPPPPPPLRILRELGIPTVDNDTFQAAVARSSHTRRVLAGLLKEDGWPWERIFEQEYQVSMIGD